MVSDKLMANKNTGYGNVWLFWDVTTKSVFTLIEIMKDMTPVQSNLADQWAYRGFLQEYR